MVGAQQNCGVILQFSTSALNLAELWKYRNTSDVGRFSGMWAVFLYHLHCKNLWKTRVSAVENRTGTNCVKKTLKSGIAY